MAKEILVVDDDFDDLELTKGILEGSGYAVNTVPNGAEALDILGDKVFDLILLDIQMPTLSGYDLLRIMREKINHNAKMVYISIVPKKDVVIDEVDGFVQKPFSKESLLNVVKQALGE